MKPETKAEFLTYAGLALIVVPVVLAMCLLYLTGNPVEGVLMWSLMACVMAGGSLLAGWVPRMKEEAKRQRVNRENMDHLLALSGQIDGERLWRAATLRDLGINPNENWVVFPPAHNFEFMDSLRRAIRRAQFNRVRKKVARPVPDIRRQLIRVR